MGPKVTKRAPVEYSLSEIDENASEFQERSLEVVPGTDITHNSIITLLRCHVGIDDQIEPGAYYVTWIGPMSTELSSCEYEDEKPYFIPNKVIENGCTLGTIQKCA